MLLFTCFHADFVLYLKPKPKRKNYSNIMTTLWFLSLSCVSHRKHGPIKQVEHPLIKKYFSSFYERFKKFKGWLIGSCRNKMIFPWQFFLKHFVLTTCENVFFFSKWGMKVKRVDTWIMKCNMYDTKENDGSQGKRWERSSLSSCGKVFCFFFQVQTQHNQT